MTSTRESLAELLANASAVLFDFDGPICDIFAGLPAPTVARRLEVVLGKRFGTKDPLEVLRQSENLSLGALRATEDALIEAELEAIDKSATTYGGLESIESCLLARKSVGIVSNNSTQAITRFLEHANLLTKVYPISGRVYANPALMKPNPHLLKEALRHLRIPPQLAVLIGDSLTDFQAAHTIGVKAVAYANKEDKLISFSKIGIPVIENMIEIANAVT